MADPRIHRAHAERLRVEKEIRDIYDAAGDNELSAEETAKVEALDERSSDLAVTVSDLLAAEQRNADIDKALEGLPAPEPRNDAGVAEARDLSAELRELANGERRQVVVTPESRDLTVGTATDGAELVPTTFYGMLVEHMLDTSGVMMAGATILNTTSGENIEVPVTTSKSTADLEGEGDAIAESDPQFATRTLGAYKFAHLVQVSRELVEDSAIDLLGFLARQSGEAVGLDAGTYFAVGSGSSQPAGIVTGSTLGETGATSVSGAFDADNLIDLFYSVNSQYRNSPAAAWLMRDASIASLRKLEDGAGNRMFQPSLALGQPDTLLGKPIYTDPNIVAQALDAKSVIFGDISRYFIRIAGGVRFERSDHYAFNTDLVTFKCVMRADGILTDQTGAVKHFVGGAS